jgi:hypothetical protein
LPQRGSIPRPAAVHWAQMIPYESFKKCSSCLAVWTDREAFLSDADLTVVGYQANFEQLGAGFFLFEHGRKNCGTTLAIDAGRFTDLHEGPIFRRRQTGSEECPGYCLRKTALDACTLECECAYVRGVLQVVRTWPKRRTPPTPIR